MTPSDDLSPPRRPIFFPVVIATVFLTIIGLTAGFMLGERRRDEEKVSNAGSGQAQSLPGSNPQPAPTRGGVACPPETLKFAAAEGFPPDLRQVLRIKTDNGTIAWICEDPQQRLYYQGKTPRADGKLVQRENGLFLPGVTEVSTGEYLAVANNGNKIFVSRDLLEIRFTDGESEQHRVVAAE